MADRKPAARTAGEVCHKVSEGVGHKAVAATDAHMAAIRQYAVGEVTPEAVFIGQMRLANTLVDRSFEKFPVAYLHRFAETLPGKSLMPGHDYSQTPLGRFFDAEVMADGEGGHCLLARYYTRADAPITGDIKLGVAKDASIGFTPGDRTCDLCGRSYYGADANGDYCPHWAGDSYDGHLCTLTYGGDLSQVEAVEGSLVWLGAQYGAQTTRNAAAIAAKTAYIDQLRATAAPERKEDTMELTEAVAKIAALEAEKKALETDKKTLSPLAEAGEKYRKFLLSEILRLKKSMGEEAEGAALATMLENADTATLESFHKAADEKHAKAFAASGAELGGAGADPIAPAKRTRDQILCGEG
jgi:hypothetical protein